MNTKLTNSSRQKLPSYLLICLLIVASTYGCQTRSTKTDDSSSKPYIKVLGIAQDAGYPQIGCKKECCTHLLKSGSIGAYTSSLAILDPASNQYWILDASPDIKYQVEMVQRELGKDILPSGIFLSHAHIGHYTGLMYFGRESMSSDSLPVYCMSRMSTFLSNNGPWSQLVDLGNIVLRKMTERRAISMTPTIQVTPLRVPHRDEFSETVGFMIELRGQKILFIPDIDKWNLWDSDIIDLLDDVDIGFLDGTFYSQDEIPNRDMSEIPHPFIKETMDIFASSSEKIKSKIHFIHLNHSNPALWDDSTRISIEQEGYNIAVQGNNY